jgi:23S rRNA pseudouridine1911/1915/1917 synthase
MRAFHPDATAAPHPVPLPPGEGTGEQRHVSSHDAHELGADLNQAEMFSFTVSDAEDGLRLDQALAVRVPGLSRRRARVLIDLGGVFIDRRRSKVAGRPLQLGEKVVAHLGGALSRAENRVGQEARAVDEERLPAYQIVFEDDDVIVVDKPAGLLTAPTPESDRGNLLGLLARRGGGRHEVHLVHRLDMPTSGLIIFAKTSGALKTLSERFRTHDLVRQYLTVVAGHFPARVSLIEQPIERKSASTRIEVVERLGVRATFLRCTLDTGRTHQIRIHCRSLGHPVLGDRQYGQATSSDPPRLALHAARLALPHPVTGAALDFDSPWPPDLAPWLAGLRAGATGA